MNKIIGYFSSGVSWRSIKKEDYEKEFSHDEAMKYLKNEILESIDREMANIKPAAFYAGIRFLFPEVNHLAHLYFGHRGNDWIDKEKRLVPLFMKKFNIFTPESVVYYKVFRNGLMHSHHPKWLKRGKVVGWYINSQQNQGNFGININEFKDKIKTSASMFLQELEFEKNTNKRLRLNKFIEAMTDFGKIYKKNELRNKKRS